MFCILLFIGMTVVVVVGPFRNASIIGTIARISKTLKEGENPLRMPFISSMALC